MKIQNKNLVIFLQALVILVFGFILLNLTFGFCAFVYSTCDRIFGVSPEFEQWFNWQYETLRATIFIVIMAVATYNVYKSKLITIYKAIWTMVPVAVVMVFMGIWTYHWPILSYLFGTIITMGIITYLYLNKQPWPYYLSVLFVSISLLVMVILGVDI